MDPSISESEASQVIEIKWGERWQVYRRLQELEIPCHCKTDQPLRAEIDNVMALIQIWSILRQLTLPRQELISWLDDCWRLPSKRRKERL
ncbi:Asr1405/Asl0597 family protein [Moorena sp. SIO3H5]|uniref:Asr1405/Asl0597 family protein n=1 Tax=Moorena sp. SIO3H5 TaxID=2607834 RepID=UPI0013B71E39|nr:Asr1405/Asl0597 family protein [Moorena sp. SIO3H5]NEO72004.1 hypothetical protein [Moorena sp. SIO3H5]